MRIGVVTWYEGNYGSILQAYATRTLIDGMGHEPIFIQYDFGGGTFDKLMKRARIVGIKHVASQYIAKVRGHFAMRPHQPDLDNRAKAMRLFVDKNLEVTKRRYSSKDYAECISEVDAFVCGSDQIWNPAITCFSPYYWLAFVPEEIPKISYAPSMGKMQLGCADARFVAAQIRTYQSISVRESATAKMLNGISGLNKYVETVVDPTLLVSKGHWEKLSDTSPVGQDGERYAFAYLLRGNAEQRAFASKLARERGLKLVVYPYLEAIPQGADAETWGDKRVFDDDPADFLARIRRASLVITDSFHCTVFSILFHRDFYVVRKTFDTTSQTTRIDELLSIAGLSNRVLERLEITDDAGDFDEAERRLTAHAQQSKAYLEDAIKRAEQSVRHR